MAFPEAARTIALVAATLLGMVGWLAAGAVRLPASSPNRLVAELRLAQLAGIVLAFIAGAYIGFAAVRPGVEGSGLEVALSLGFLVIAVTAPLRDPREALTILALAFAAHSLVDVLHRPDFLPADLVPHWYVIGCAVLNALCGALCYLPLLRR